MHLDEIDTSSEVQQTAGSRKQEDPSGILSQQSVRMLTTLLGLRSGDLFRA